MAKPSCAGKNRAPHEQEVEMNQPRPEWADHLEVGIREVLTNVDNRLNEIAVHDDEQADWGLNFANWLVNQPEFLHDPKRVHDLCFVVVGGKLNHERWPIGSIFCEKTHRQFLKNTGGRSRDEF